jgi:hypothetical protein
MSLYRKLLLGSKNDYNIFVLSVQLVSQAQQKDVKRFKGVKKI